MNRTKKLKLNSIVSLAGSLVTIVSGLILPRLILSHYGSTINGLVQSINQFLSIITFLDLGIGNIVQSSLYKPLAEKNIKKTSQVLSAAKSYFNNIAKVLVVYVILLMVFYPVIINNDMGWFPTAFLIFAISISKFGQYYFGITNELLLNADQRGYIQLSSEITVVIINLIISIILIISGFSIQFVKLASSLIYILRPMYLSYYITNNYEVDRNVEIDEDPLPQKWVGITQHIAYTVQNSADIIILTLFSTLESVSIYSVYSMVVLGVRTFIDALTNSLKSFFGDLIAKNEIVLLNSYFDKVEWLSHTSNTFIFGMTAVLINSFVLIYTSGVNDVNYYVPAFSIILVLSQYIYCLRTPYNAIIFSAGHYKETQSSYVIETAINVILSVILLSDFGLFGVALGSLVAILYRTIYLVIYLSKNVVYRDITIFIKQCFVDLIGFLGILMISYSISYIPTSFINWVIYAFFLALIYLIFLITINLIFYKNNTIFMFNRVFGKIFSRR